jgi:uncharacterized protein YfaS (alpha-2-macroglobulin family)
MKSYAPILAALLVVSPLSHAAPRLVVSTPSLAPESQIDLVLDLAAIAPEAVGSTVDNDWFTVAPPLPGKLRWKAPNIAEFLPDQSPAMGTTYVFTMKPERTHLDGSAIPEGTFARLESETFRPLGWNSVGNRYSADYSSANASWIVYFNDAIDPSAIAPSIHFQSDGRQTVRASLQPVTWETMGYYGQNTKTWESRWKPAQQAIATTPSDLTPHAVMVSPASALPPGKNWKMVLTSGLPNKSATARTTENLHYSIGTIDPFLVSDIVAVTEINTPRTISIYFNAPLPDQLPDNLLTELLQITPRPENLQARADGRTLHITGDLAEIDAYKVSLQTPLVSRVGHPLQRGYTEEIRFQHAEAGLSLPSDQQAQYSEGTRTYGIHTVNLSRVTLRVKQLGGSQLVRAFQGYRNYTGTGHNGENISPTSPLPWPMVAGPLVAERAFDLTDQGIDTSKEIEFRWDDILPNHRTGIFFVDATGDPHAGLGERHQRRNAQAIVQLTDIGLAWKLTPQDTLVQAFSCQTGKPLADVVIRLYGEDAAVLHSGTTDARGLATLPRSTDARHLLAQLRKDAYITAFDSSMSTVGLWHFPVRYSWSKPAEVARRAFLFTDRPLYRPGETIRLKGIVRNLRGNTLEHSPATAARLILLDPTEKEIRTENITISPNGSFDITHELAPETVGDHTIRLEYPEELAALPAQGDDDEYGDWETRERILNNARFEITVQVQEFRRNAFEITQKTEPAAPGATTISGSLTAKYYQGQPVAVGAVKQYARITTLNPYPERFRDFQFGNHRSYDYGYWYHYFGYRGDSSENTTESFQHNAEFSLNAEGSAAFEIQLPESNFPTRREVRVSTEVTDARLQTLTSTTTATVDSSSVYVGISRVDRLLRAGDDVPLRIVAVDTQGNPFSAPIQINASLTREVNEATKVLGENGSTTTRNNTREESVITSQFTLAPAASQAEGQPFVFKPTQSGLHFLTLHGTDPDGRPFSTVTRFHVYGTQDYPWLYEDGLRIKLVAEKTKYQPGETARVLVLSPIEGTALVTVEREKILRTFHVDLRSENPVIDIPLGEDDAPNAFVSVLVIKGASESARDQKEPQLRLGYCELLVDNLRDKLAVKIDEPAASYRPGEDVTLTGKIQLADGSPAAGAEVTFFAEDEGTLAVTGYDTPDPMAFFYEPRHLLVESGTSFESFLSENPEFRSYFNKGFFVGGGGDMSLLEELRKNFDPCAAWAPALIAAEDGSFRHTFRLPDTLTRYRIIAVAHHGTARFGHAESSITVKKDLMLEPKPPRFAHQGDELHTQLLVQNASHHNGTWTISFQAHATTGQPVCFSDEPLTRTVSLAAGASASLDFPIRAATTGEAVLTWSAVPVSLERGSLTPDLTKRLSDAVEARFPVLYPMPLLRQTQLVRLDRTTRDLLPSFDRNLLNGIGTIDLEFAHSPLLEAAGSIDYLLHYPHGCLEQTTSALIPWCSVDALRKVVPAFSNTKPHDVRAALQAGVNRLLSMQLANGAFSYWPGQTDAVDWATPYAGMGLLLASEAGAHIPESSKTSLVQALTESLRGMAENKSPSALETHARALYVLALAGQPQFSYQNSLAERVAELTPSARALLAAAIARGNPEDRPAARALLVSSTPLRLKDDSWMPYSPSAALALLAWTEIDPTSDACHKALDKLIRDRSPYGHWRTTWMNGWSLVALAAYAKHDTTPATDIRIDLTTDAGPETLSLSSTHATASRSFPLAAQMKLSLQADPSGFLRATLRSRPPIAPLLPVATNGMSIDRIHQRILADGTVEPLTQPKPGDLIQVTLRVTLPHDDTRYLVIEDPLPALFETVSSDFASQRSALQTATSENDWNVSHSELRSDRAVFYLDHIWRRGTYTLTYLARCTLPGTATAPPAKVESMYDPDHVALSASRTFEAK